MKKKLSIILLLLIILPAVNAQEASIKIAGVRQTSTGYEGMLSDLNVEVRDGKGRVFLDTMPLSEIDTQASARLAREVACKTLVINCEDKDFFYIIRGDTPMIGGPSAGGAMTLATMAALSNKTVYNNILMTGTINPDGTIGQVSGIVEKIEAAYKDGKDLILLPVGQSMYVTPLLETIDLKEYAKENWNVTIKEISDIEEAYKEATGYEIVHEQKNEGDITSKMYDEIMEGMAEKLIENIENLKKQLINEINQTDTYRTKQELEKVLEQENQAIKNIKQNIQENENYVAASRALQSSIDITNNLLISRLSKSENIKVELKQEIDETNQEIMNYAKDYTAMINNEYDLELVIASLDRLYEAQENIEGAYQYYYILDYNNVIGMIATAKQRLITAKEWNSASERLSGNESIKFNQTLLKTLAQERATQAENAITYAGTISNVEIISSLYRELERIKTAIIEEKYARAIFESLRIIGDSNRIMEIRGLNTDRKKELFQRKYESIVRVISRQMYDGALPILAKSYLEYAKYFNENNDTDTAIAYINYANQYATLSNDVKKMLGYKTEEINRPIIKKLSETKIINESITPLMIGLLIGFVLVWIIKR